MRIYANSYDEIVLSESKLRDQFTEAFNARMGDSSDYFLRIDIQDEQGGVMVDIEAETDFDQNTILDYWEYKSIMEEIGQPAMSKSEYYETAYNEPTLVDKMDEILKQYNPDWYFELYDACHIQAYLDNAVLEV